MLSTVQHCEAPLTTSLNLTWVPGTIDRVRFEHEGRTYTVFLRDVQRENVHSVGALYLTGRVRLRVSKLHHAQLTGLLAHTVSGHAPESVPGTLPPDE